MDPLKKTPDLFAMELDETARATFLEMARWTKFLSILGFIAMGLMILGGVVLSAVSASLPGDNPLAMIGATGVLLYFLVISALIFYPTYMLLKYSVSVK